MMAAPRGATRESLRQLSAELAQPGNSLLPAGEVLAVVALLGREHGLRNAITDPASPPEVRSGVVTTLLRGRVSEPTLRLLQRAASLRWSSARELPDALEALGAQAAFLAAERDGTLDAVEDELFRFGRVLDAQPELRRALEDPALEEDRKVGLLRDLLQDKVQPVTLELLEHVVRSPRGRRPGEAVDDLVALAAQRSQEVLAEVRVATPLTAEQEQRMSAALAGIYRRSVRLQVAVDPTVLGGAVVRVGDEVIDGSVADRLEQARRRLAG